MQYSTTSRSTFHASAHWLLPIVAMVGLTAWPQAASARNIRPRAVAVQQEADPAVISGIGITEAERMFGAPQGARPTAPAPSVRVADNNMGGGFLELMLGGGARYNEPPRTPVARQANYAPNPVHQPVQRQIDPMFLRQEVDYAGSEAPGTLVVDTPSKFLYYVQGNGRAIRYGIGVGRPGFEWSGTKTISRKAEWPSWTPPAEMLLRRPDLPTFMDGGAGNPLGARALYLGSSMYRIHGTTEPWSIGTNVSSGCIRMMNEDVVDLYGRVRVGTKVVVI